MRQLNSTKRKLINFTNVTIANQYIIALWNKRELMLIDKNSNNPENEMFLLR